MKQRWLAILLSLCLVLGLMPTAVWAAQGTYVALGDSITTGYGLAGGEKSFAEQLAEDNDLTLENFAADGATSVDVLAKLAEDQVQEAVAGAQLITLTVGGNDLMGALYLYLANTYNDENPGANLAPEDVPEKILDGTLASWAAQKLSGFADSEEAAAALSTFATNFGQIITQIRALNQTAVVIVANQYNPYGHIADELEAMEQFLAQMMIITPVENGVTALNELIEASPVGYLVADVHQAFADDSGNPCNASFTITGTGTDMTYDFNPDFHPNADGHTLMAQVLGEVLDENPLPVAGVSAVVGGVTLSYVGTPVYAATSGGLVSLVTVTDPDTDPWNVKWDGQTLTLRDADVAAADGSGHSYGVRAEVDLTVALEGDNIVSGGAVSQGDSFGIYTTGTLTLTGSGRLAASGGAVEDGHRSLSLFGGNQAIQVEPETDEAVVVKVGADGGSAEEVYDSPYDVAGSLTVSQAYFYYEAKAMPFIDPVEQTYDKNSANPVAFGVYLREDQTIAQVKVDGTALTEGTDYVLSVRGSVDLAKTYLDTLGSGTHAVTVVLQDGTELEARLLVPEKVAVTITSDPVGAGFVLAENAVVNSPYYVAPGQEVTLEAAASAGYRFVAWKQGDAVVSEEETYTFTPTEDCELTVVFEPIAYALTPNPACLNFGTAQEGYAGVTAQTVTITNTGEEPLKLTVPELTYFEVQDNEPQKEVLAVGESKTFAVQPKTGLAAGTYTENLTVFGQANTGQDMALALSLYGNGQDAVAQVSLSFVVEDEDGGQGGDQDGNQGGGSSYGDTIPYRVLRFETNGGTELEDVRKLDGTQIDLGDYVTQREGYVFAGWYSDEALTRPVDVVTLSADKKVYAAWTEPEEETGWAENPFWDVTDSDWFCPAVQYVYENGLMVGTSSTTFGPNEKITRGQVVAILYRMEGSPVVAQTGEKFTDVDSSAYYADAIVWASNIGIMSGYGEGIYGPDVPMPLEQVVAVLYRYAQYKGWDVSVGADTNILSYADAQEISEYAVPAFQWACGAGVIAGDGERLNPGVVATRAQLAQISQQFGQAGTQPEA